MNDLGARLALGKAEAGPLKVHVSPSQTKDFPQAGTSEYQEPNGGDDAGEFRGGAFGFGENGSGSTGPLQSETAPQRTGMHWNEALLPTVSAHSYWT